MSDRLKPGDFIEIAEGLLGCPPDAYLERNEVGNLAIRHPALGYIGFVDFGPGLAADQRVVLFAEA